MRDWSQQFEDAYRLVLPDDVRAWLDDEIWQDPIGAEFCHPLPPEQLLSPGHNEIWAGFMPPDTLPLVGNDYGDWLCLRVGRDNRVTEVIRWSHGGGDWLPYGRTLSEAFVFDAALSVIHNQRHEFAEEEFPEEQLFGAVYWALPHIDKPLAPFWERDRGHAPESILASLIEADVAVAGATCESMLRCLESPLKAKSVPATARHFEVDWDPDFVRWIFDADLLPEEIRDSLAEHWKIPAQELIHQDWERAEALAMKVARQRNDLAWPLEIAGWAAERRQQWEQAANCYRQALFASVFTDDSIRFRTQWRPDGIGKFSAFRLQEINSLCQNNGFTKPDLSSQYLQQLWEGNEATLRNRVSAFWREQAAAAKRAGDRWGQYEALVRAGWDLGLAQLHEYRGLLEDIEEAAEQAGAAALARIAKTHHEAF